MINISSIVGLMGNAGQVLYASSKAAIIGFTKSLALEIGSRGTAPAAARTVVFLASRRATSQERC